MSNKKHILVADNSGDSLSNIGFLLHLSGFAITSFDDEIEAINWLLQQDSTLVAADMLLINHPQTQGILLALLLKLRQKYPRLQLMLVSPVSLPLSGAITTLDPPLHQCPSSEVYQRVKTIFQRDTSPGANANPMRHQDLSIPDLPKAG